MSKFKINVIIPFFKDFDTIDRLLWSLDDQDYRDFDITIVQDGPHKKSTTYLTEIIDSKKYKSKIKYECLPKHTGANAARNFGATLTEQDLQSKPGSILFFVDADCQIYPGMLTEFITQFKRNPDISFLYGNYRFDNKQEYYSKPFDPYLLETMNYISTMSPIRRSAFKSVGGFLEDQPYFHDWSLFYRLSKQGFKGKFIKDFIFTTKMPTESSISGTKGLTLSDKATKFRESHEIAHKRIVVTTHGAPLQAIQRAKMLDADYLGPVPGSRAQVFPINYQFPNWEATYMTGCYNHNIDAFTNHLAVMYGKTKIYHFIGTDVLHLLESHCEMDLKSIRGAFKLQDAHLFANSPRMVEELKQVGIDAELLYTPVYNAGIYQNLRPFPKDFTVGVYFSDTNPMHALDGAGGVSNLPLIRDVARSMPDIKFKFFGGAAIHEEENIEYVGKFSEGAEMVHFINNCSMVLRSTIHDGFPQLPIQFMLCGRHALVSCPDKELKHAHKLSFEETQTQYESCKSEIIDKIYEITTKKPLDSQFVHGYYESLMSEESFKERIYKCLES